MTDNATMFLDDISVVDHCFIDNEGFTIGGSFNPSFLVSGEIDPVEKVVVDFSTVKKQIKSFIDGKSIGFDHKCWVIENFSQAKVYINDVEYTNFLALDSTTIADDTRVVVVTTHARIEAPKNAFKFIPNPESLAYTIENAGIWFARDLERDMAPLKFVCRNNINAHTYLPQEKYPIAYFSYAHGLKDSTSYGCQNIAHGHLSFIQTNSTHPDVRKVINKIAHDLDCTMFINDQNVSMLPQWEDGSLMGVVMGYQSHSRGEFAANWKQGPKQKCVVLPTETTIEYLVDYVANKFAEQLASIDATELFVSEGLSKGAWVKLPLGGK
jgi:hypothetical protein